MASLSLSIQTRLSPLFFSLIPLPKPARKTCHPLHTPFLRRSRPIPSLDLLTAFCLFAIPIPHPSLRRQGPPILPPIFSRLRFFPEKTDVFSYGAVVLEVASGRRPIEKDVSTAGKVGVCSNLVEWVWSLYREGKLLSAADASLGDEFDE